MVNLIKKVGPGLLIVIIVALVSQFIAQKLIPNIGAVTLAIIIGMFLSNSFARGPGVIHGYHFAEKKLLPVAIVLLGTELQLQILVRLGLPTAGLILIIILTTIFSSILIGKLMGFSRPFSLLMGAGNAICGSSAIAAVSSVLESNEEDVGLSISTVNLLGTIGIFLLPLLVKVFAFDDLSGGAVIGSSLQAIGQVVAAGYSINDATGSIALLVKMGRVLMLGPLVLIITWRKTTTSASGQAIKIPPFIIGFLLVSLLASWQVTPEPLVDLLRVSGKWLLLMAMAGIGLKLHLKTMVVQGPKTLLFGLIVATIQLTTALLIILALY